MVIDLAGLECHNCGVPADYWTDGVTLPCRCGAVDWAEVDRAIDRVRDYITAGRAKR